MSGEGISPILIIVVALLGNVLPWVLALMSKKVEGLEKIIWFFSAFFASWLGYFVFYFVVVRKKNITSICSKKILRNENGQVVR